MPYALPNMSSPADASRQYPVACPHCDEVKGFPYQVRTMSAQPGSIEVKLRCRDCNHEWVEIVTNQE
jgi:DNA-directed RNA polymerase subunit M/transcription elongation factor TFIIS